MRDASAETTQIFHALGRARYKDLQSVYHHDLPPRRQAGQCYRGCIRLASDRLPSMFGGGIPNTSRERFPLVLGGHTGQAGERIRAVCDDERFRHPNAGEIGFRKRESKGKTGWSVSPN